MPEYVARFEMSEIKGQTEEERKKEIESNAEKSVNKKGIDTKTIGKVLTVASTAAKMAYQIYAKNESAINSIRGDSIAQNHLDNQTAYFNEGLTLFQIVGVGGATGGLIGVGVGLGFYGLSKVVQGYNVYQDNRVKQASWQIETLNNAVKQQRLVQNITSNRI